MLSSYRSPQDCSDRLGRVLQSHKKLYAKQFPVFLATSPVLACAQQETPDIDYTLIPFLLPWHRVLETNLVRSICFVLVIPKCPMLWAAVTTCFCSSSGITICRQRKSKPLVLYNPCLSGSKVSFLVFSCAFPNHCALSFSGSFGEWGLRRCFFMLFIDTPCSLEITYLTIFSVVSLSVSGSGCRER